MITAAVGSTDVLLALIGDEWLTITDEQGRRRLDDPDDFVRLEIEAALARKVRLIPILVDGARMPRADELPPSLAPLARRQALELSPSRFDFDTSRLLKVLEKTLAEERTAKDDAASMTASAVKAPAPSTTEAYKAPEQREYASRGRTRSVPPRAAAAPGWRRRLSARPRILIGVGVCIAAVLLALLIAAITANSNTTPPRDGENPPSEAIPFVDDFSSQEHGWDDAGDTQTGGHYRDGAYYISAERVDDGWGVIASPRNASSAANLRIKVDARRTSGTAQLGYGYGIFCRADGPDNLYAFTIWLRHATIGKRIDGHYTALGDPNPGVTSAVQGDTQKELQAVCRSVNGQRAVDLRFWVNGDMILQRRDSDNPLESGSFGLHATLSARGSIGETLDVKFDNFEVSED